MDEDQGLFVRKSISLPAEPAQVWRALTDPELTKQYYFGCEFISSWEPGSPVESRFEYEGQVRTATKGVIVAARRDALLEYTCYTPDTEHDPSKHTKIAFELEPADGGTRLLVRQGPFADEQTLQDNDTSCEMVLQGLAKLLASGAAQA